MKKLILTGFILVAGAAVAQSMNYKGNVGGTLSFGQRTTLSTFNHDQEASTFGIGGQFRIRLSDRINTEWFFDYLPATNTFSRRTDYHIGWSVLFYPFNHQNERFMPYVLAGHCFDYTHHVEIANRNNDIERWSSAIQAGIGTHYNFTERLDASLSAQYMIHLGTDVHSHVFSNGQVFFEEHAGGSFEGHLLITLSFNYKFGDLWKRG